MKHDAAEPHAEQPGAGVLLINLGTPSAPEPAAIRRYLAEFLSDRRVIDLHPVLWKPILHGFILPFRPQRLAHAYKSVWTGEGAPLLAATERLGAAVEAQLRRHLNVSNIRVAVGMRYGTPTIAAALDTLAAFGARKLLVLPLYPQYSATTTAAALDAVWPWLAQQRWVPEVRTINSYHDDIGYIRALAERVRGHWRVHGRGQHLLMSFHGMPQRYVLAGDPYYCHCHKTARLLAAELELDGDSWTVSFQSRFGRGVWLKPYTDALLPLLAKRNVRRLDVIAPGFAADCLETLEEIAMRYRSAYEKLGCALRYIPALNDSPNHVTALSDLLADTLKGWMPPLYGSTETAARMQRYAARSGEFSGVARGIMTPPDTSPDAR
jgi:ferrochelatase